MAETSHQPQETKQVPEKSISTVLRPKFGMSGSVLASKGPNGENYYVSVLDQEVTAPGQYIQLLDTLYHAKKGDVVHIKIYSFGGWVSTGISLLQAIYNTQAHVITTGMSIVASIAAVIWLCGHERRMMPGSALMIHMPSGGQFGKTLDIEDETHQLNEFFGAFLRDIGKGIITDEEFTKIIDNREDTFIPGDIVVKRLKALEGKEDVV